MLIRDLKNLMRIFAKILTATFILVFPLDGFAGANTTLISKPYDASGQIAYNSETYAIPNYIPGYSKNSDLYVVINTETFSPHGVEIFYGLTPDCTGHNVCGLARYSRDKITGTFQNIVIQALDAISKNEIPLMNGALAYFIEGKCFAYCNESTLVWLRDDYVYTVSSKMYGGDPARAIDELTKMANSVISND